MQNRKLEISTELSASNAMRCVVGCFSFFSVAATAWSCNIIIMTPHLKCGKTYYCCATHFTLCVGSLTLFMLIRICICARDSTHPNEWILKHCCSLQLNWYCCVYVFCRFFTTMSSSVGIHNEHLSCFGCEQRWDKLKFPFADFGECVNVPWRLTAITWLENKSHFEIQQLQSISFCLNLYTPNGRIQMHSESSNILKKI